MTNHTGEKLSELISQRHDCLLQMYKLGLKQSELVASGEISALLRLLSVKNQLITVLQTIEKSLAPFHAQDPESRVWPSTALRDDCAAQIDDCQRLLDKIMKMERENERLMTDRRDQVAIQLQAVQSASAARRAYQTHKRHTSSLPTISHEQSDPPTNLQVEA